MDWQTDGPSDSAIETVVPPEEMRRIFRKLWPLLAEMLDSDHLELIDALIGVAGDWLRIGGDYDRPFAQSHHPDCVAAAKQIGEALVAELADRTDLSLGTRVYLRSTAEFHDVQVSVDIPPDVKVFFREVERGKDNWREAEQTLVADLKTKAEDWVSEDPLTIIGRLVELRAELKRAKVQWPDRTWIVCQTLAEKVVDPLAWLKAAEAAGFMPEGCRFADRALEAGDLIEEHAGALLADPKSRTTMIGMMLASSSAPEWAARQAAEALTAHDYRLIETLVVREELSDEGVRLLLGGAGLVRAMVAIALFSGRRREDGWSPGQFEGAWLDALLDLRASELPEVPHYEIAELFEYLAQQYPDTLADLVERSLAEAENAEVYRVLPHDCRNALYRLPAGQKLRLWRRFRDQPITNRLLRDHLVGADIEWLKEMLDGGEMSAEEALGAFRGTGLEPPIDRLAKLLVPRGVDPERIADLQFYGSWMGDQSDRYQSIVASFEEMSKEADPSVQAVAQAGVKMFSAARDEAAAQERQQRIRGER